MKKSQRARLATLAATAEASRSAEEKIEFTYLSALATLHADASKDIDDTSPAAAPAAAAPVTAVASPAAGANAPPAAAANAPFTLRGFVASLKNGPKTGTALVTAEATVATLTAERNEARTQVATLSSQLSTLNSQLSAFATFFGLPLAELAGKTAAEVSALMQQKISAEGADLVAGLGVPLAQLPAGGKGDQAAEAGSLAALQSEYATLAAKDPVAAGKFYQAKIAPLFNRPGNN